MISMMYELQQCLSQANGICLAFLDYVALGSQFRSLDHWGVVPVPGSQ